MIALDLFCGAGGASKGLLDAGFERVIGLDNKLQEEYFDKYEFVFADSLNQNYVDPKAFDFIWASPPCQAYSIGTKGFRNKGKKYPDLIAKTRKLLIKTGKPFVIENVPGSPIRKDLMLCGEMFNLKIIRHRWFEVNGFECKQPKHKKHKRSVCKGTAVTVCTGVVNPGCFGKRAEYKKLYGKKWKKNASLEAWQKAMKIDWIKDKHTLAQCVPPAYAEYIGKEFLRSRT